MAKFIDFHAKMPQLPPTTMKDLEQQLRTGKRDEYGVKPLNAYFSPDGQAWGVSEADNADAVCKSHAAHGVNIGKGDVHEVKSVL